VIVRKYLSTVFLMVLFLTGCDAAGYSDKYGYVDTEYTSHLTIEEIVNLDKEINIYLSGRARDLDWPELDLSKNARNRLAHEIAQRFQSKHISNVEALSFITKNLCLGGIEDVECFYNYKDSIWNAFSSTDAEVFIKSVVQLYDDEKDTANKEMFGVFLGNAYESAEGVSINYEKAVQYYESAWSLGYKPAAKGLYEIYTHFGTNNKCNAYLWAIRSGAYLNDIEQKMSSKEIADTQKAAPDITVLKM